MSDPVARLSGRFAALVLVLLVATTVSACASSGGGDGDAAAMGGSSTLIVRAQLQNYAGQSAMDAVRRFNRRWLLADRGAGGSSYARVVIDGGAWYTLGVLEELSANDVESMRFLSFNAATRSYGAGFEGGVIEVRSRGN